MAIDRDDEVARRYRALAREEPPAQLDAAILAASRRAVGARPGGLRRWGPPVSIAAMLVLATGVVLRMQSEQPGIETSAPAVTAPVPAQTAPASAPVTTQAAEPAPPPPPAEARKKAIAPERKRIAEPKPGPQPFARQASPVAAPPPPPPFEAASPPAASPPAAPPAAAAGAAASGNLMRDTGRDEATAKRAQAPRALTLEKSELAETPEAALDRIARLRAERRDEEADRALEAFRRDHPGYRIPEAQWERVRPRAP